MIALALGLVLSPAYGLAASFDCGKAKGPVEKVVCADAELSDLDDMLGRYYHGAVAALKENARCLAADQRDWLRHRRDECADAACLRSAYLDRLSELQALQPGINTQRRLALPPRSALLWAIAPEPYLFAAPRVAYPSRPARIEGSFLREEYGFAVREADGRTYLVIPDMMLGGASAIVLPLLAKTEPGLKVIARGHVALGGHGDPYFDHRHCIFIHRIAP